MSESQPTTCTELTARVPDRRLQFDRAPAVVLGLDNMTGLQSARLLARRGIPVIGVSLTRRHPCSATRLCAARLVTESEGELLIQTLLELGQRMSRPAVLFPTTDRMVLTVSENRHRLTHDFRFSLPDRDLVEQLTDKNRFQELAAERGWPTPRTERLRSINDAREAARRLRLPCIVKPSLKTEEWEAATHQKAFLVNGADDMCAVYERYHRCAESLLAQEWIPGAEYWTSNCYFDARGHERAMFVTRKIRQWPAKTGTGCSGEARANEEVVRLTREIFNDLGFRGQGYIEFKRDERDGRYVIIEPNIGRPTGRSATAEAAGVELQLTQYLDSLGEPLPPEPPTHHSPPRWVYWRRDIRAAYHLWRRGELSFADWRNSVRRPRVSAVFDWTDPLPFVADLFCAAARRCLHRDDTLDTDFADSPMPDPARRRGQTVVESLTPLGPLTGTEHSLLQTKT